MHEGIDIYGIDNAGRHCFSGSLRHCSLWCLKALFSIVIKGIVLHRTWRNCFLWSPKALFFMALEVLLRWFLFMVLITLKGGLLGIFVYGDGGLRWRGAYLCGIRSNSKACCITLWHRFELEGVVCNFVTYWSCLKELFSMVMCVQTLYG